MTKLYHPLIAPNGRSFPDKQAKKMMAMLDNGGWTDKKQEDAESSRPKKKAKETGEDASN